MLQKKANKIIETIAMEMKQGNIDIKPTYSLKSKCATCQWCEYKGICGFNPSSSVYVYVGNKSKDTILSELKGEKK